MSVNIDKKLKEEVNITKRLREFRFDKEIGIEVSKAWKDSKYSKRNRTVSLMEKLKADLIASDFKGHERLRDLTNEYDKIIADSKYLKFPYSKQAEDFAEAHVRVNYNDGKVVEPLSKKYKELKRTDIKSATVVSESGKDLFTLDIINNKFIYRMRNIPPAIQDQKRLRELSHPNYDQMGMKNPKRCFVLATEGRIVFVWDSGEVTEITEWSQIRPYNSTESIRKEEEAQK